MTFLRKKRNDSPVATATKSNAEVLGSGVAVTVGIGDDWNVPIIAGVDTTVISSITPYVSQAGGALCQAGAKTIGVVSPPPPSDSGALGADNTPCANAADAAAKHIIPAKMLAFLLVQKIVAFISMIFHANWLDSGLLHGICKPFKCKSALVSQTGVLFDIRNRVLFVAR